MQLAIKSHCAVGRHSVGGLPEGQANRRESDLLYMVNGGW